MWQAITGNAFYLFFAIVTAVLLVNKACEIIYMHLLMTLLEAQRAKRAESMKTKRSTENKLDGGDK